MTYRAAYKIMPLMLALGVLVGLLTACQPAQTHDPLTARFVPRCDGIDVYVSAVDDTSPVPTAIAFGGPGIDTRDHVTPIRYIDPGTETVWSFWSRPARITVLLGDVGWISQDIDYTALACT